MPTATPTVEVEIPATMAGWTPVFEGLNLARWERQTDNGEHVYLFLSPEGVGLEVQQKGGNCPRKGYLSAEEYLSPMKAVEVADAIAKWFGGWA